MPINNQAPDLPVTIKNTGNKDVSVSFKQPTLTDFALNWTGSPEAVTVAAGATIPGVVARFRPSKLTLQSTTAPFTVKGESCGSSATSVAMTGKGTGGVVGISPGQLDFGKVNCGGKAGFQVFTILNSGNSPFDWTAAFGLGAASSFDVSPVSGTVLAGSQASVFVTPKDIPATSAVTNNLYGDTLTVTTTAASDTPHPVTLLMTAKGAILAFTAKPADYGTRGLFSAPQNQTATLSNTGNAPANVTLSVGSPSFTTAPAGGTVAAGASLDTTVAFAPALFGDVNDQLDVEDERRALQSAPRRPAAHRQGQGSGHPRLGRRGRAVELDARARREHLRRHRRRPCRLLGKQPVRTDRQRRFGLHCRHAGRRPELLGRRCRRRRRPAQLRTHQHRGRLLLGPQQSWPARDQRRQQDGAHARRGRHERHLTQRRSSSHVRGLGRGRRRRERQGLLLGPERERPARDRGKRDEQDRLRDPAGGRGHHRRDAAFRPAASAGARAARPATSSAGVR